MGYQQGEATAKLARQGGPSSSNAQLADPARRKRLVYAVPKRGNGATFVLNLGAIQCYSCAGIMGNQSRGRGALAPGLFSAAILAFTLSACTPLWGGAALVGLVAIGTLTSRCYDYLSVTVLDADGRKTCAATVSASNGGTPFELPSCYDAPLTDGHWTLRASLPGFADAVSTVDVDHAHDCTRHVQTVELTLKRAGSSPTQRVPPTAPSSAVPPAAITQPPAPAQPLAPASSAPPSTAPAVAPPAVSPAVPSAQPASSAAPSVGVFPDASPTPH